MDENKTKEPEKQIQQRPVEIEAEEKEGVEIKKTVVPKQNSGEKSSEKEEVDSDNRSRSKEKVRSEISPEDEKKIMEEAGRKKAKEKLEAVKNELRSGDTVKVYTIVKEGDKERIQGFAGIVISKRGRGVGKTFTVRKIAVGGIGVERIWPLSSPTITEIEIVKKGNARRAKLYYLRDRIGKAAVTVGN